jgi:hypothetical protein
MRRLLGEKTRYDRARIVDLMGADCRISPLLNSVTSTADESKSFV